MVYIVGHGYLFPLKSAPCHTWSRVLLTGWFDIEANFNADGIEFKLLLNTFGPRHHRGNLLVPCVEEKYGTVFFYLSN